MDVYVLYLMGFVGAQFAFIRTGDSLKVKIWKSIAALFWPTLLVCVAFYALLPDAIDAIGEEIEEADHAKTAD
jgi:hypothetical protein